MARFDVYRNSGKHAPDVPFLLDVQSELIDGLDTRVVIPLRRRDRFPAQRLPERLTPVFAIESHDYLLETPKLAAVPKSLLGAPVRNLEVQRATILAALDFLFAGY